MVRRSTLVYDLLKSERRDDGFTPKEIIDRVSQAYAITVGKGLRKQVAVALRRGIDFGIIARKNNKYRFDAGSSAVIEAWAPRKKPNMAINNASTNAKKKRKIRRKPRTSATGQSKSNKHRKRSRLSSRRPTEPPPPRPKVPRPPNWNPKRRNLSEEPIPKIIKHPSSNPSS